MANIGADWSNLRLESARAFPAPEHSTPHLPRIDGAKKMQPFPSHGSSQHPRTAQLTDGWVHTLAHLLTTRSKESSNSILHTVQTDLIDLRQIHQAASKGFVDSAERAAWRFEIHRFRNSMTFDLGERLKFSTLLLKSSSITARISARPFQRACNC